MRRVEKFDYQIKSKKCRRDRKKCSLKDGGVEISHKAKNQENMLNITHENMQKRNNK